MPKIIKINNKFLGEGRPVFIIAEAGVNHNGSLALAKKLVDAAKLAGADAVKFQTFYAEDVVVRNAKKESYMKTKDKNQYQMLKRLELSAREFTKLADYCAKKRIIFLATPSERRNADFLEALGVGAFKIGSGDITHIPLLSHIARKGLPIIISTGASRIDEIAEAVGAAQRQGNNKIILLHCTSFYPAPLDHVNLRALGALRKRFKVLVGYSDHTLGSAVSVGAVALGACVIEKHLTLNKRLSGPDQSASLEPEEFKNLVLAIRQLEQSLGSPIKRPAKIEREERALGRRSIVAEHDIKKGTILRQSMLSIKRPGTGLAPKYTAKIIGKKTKRILKKDSLIKWSDVV